MKRARDDEPDLVLLEHVARAVADAGLGPRVRGAAEPERLLVVVGSLLRVPDPQLDVIPPVERHEVFGHALDSTAAVAGVAAAASTAATSSSERRSGCSFTQTTAITPDGERDAGRDEERRVQRVREARPERPAAAGGSPSPRRRR